MDYSSFTDLNNSDKVLFLFNSVDPFVSAEKNLVICLPIISP